MSLINILNLYDRLTIVTFCMDFNVPSKIIALLLPTRLHSVQHITSTGFLLIAVVVNVVLNINSNNKILSEVNCKLIIQHPKGLIPKGNTKQQLQQLTTASQKLQQATMDSVAPLSLSLSLPLSLFDSKQTGQTHARRCFQTRNLYPSRSTNSGKQHTTRAAPRTHLF